MKIPESSHPAESKSSSTAYGSADPAMVMTLQKMPADTREKLLLKRNSALRKAGIDPSTVVSSPHLTDQLMKEVLQMSLTLGQQMKKCQREARLRLFTESVFEHAAVLSEVGGDPDLPVLLHLMKGEVRAVFSTDDPTERKKRLKHVAALACAAAMGLG